MKYTVYYTEGEKDTYDSFEHEFSVNRDGGDLMFYRFGVLVRGYAKGTWTKVEAHDA